MSPTIRFGRYTGWTIAHVAKINPGWLVWFVATRRLATRWPEAADAAKAELVRIWTAEFEQQKGRAVAGDLV
jgi:hypothetical protein